MALLVAVAAIGAALAPAAVGAQEVGDRCTADDSEANWTVVALTNGFDNGAVFPDAVPPGGGKVITGWKVQVGAGLAPLVQQLVTFKQVGAEDDRLLGESAIETLHEGVNEFAVRIPVPEYAHVGLRGPERTLFCNHEEGHVAGSVTGPWSIGETRHLDIEAEFGAPVVAFAEPDADGDGYGDQTQDACRGNPAFAAPCPPIGLRAKARQEQHGPIIVTARTEYEAGIFVSGRVSWRAGRSGNGKPRRVSFPLSSLAWVYPHAGETVRLPVRLKKPIRNRLKHIDADEFLKAKLTVEAMDKGERSVRRQLTVRLRGLGL